MQNHHATHLAHIHIVMFNVHIFMIVILRNMMKMNGNKYLALRGQKKKPKSISKFAQAMKYPQSELGRVALYFLIGFAAYLFAAHLCYLESNCY